MSIIKRSIGAWLSPTLAVALIVLFAGSMSQTASSQAIGGLGGSFGGPSTLQYTPRPTLSPYLNLFTNPNGYAQYQLQVQPFLQQNQLNYQQNAAINQLQGQVNQLRSSSGLGTSGGGRLGATGQGGMYMNYSHYYPGRR
jgi:hypothetical protein